MALDGCGVLCKYIIIILNFIFAGLGIACLGFGLWLRFSGNTRMIFQIQEFQSSAFVIAVTLMIVFGTVMLIVVTFGGHGACSEKRTSLQVFSCLIVILGGTEIIIGVLAYAKREMVGLRMGEFYISLFAVYQLTSDPAIAAILTFVQNMFHCCGMTGITVIKISGIPCPKADGILEYIKMNDCPTTIATLFESRAGLVMCIFLGSGALLITALICSSILAKKIHIAIVSPQYIILSSSTPSSNFQHPQQAFLPPSSYSPLEHEPVGFTPLTETNIPIALTQNYALYTGLGN